MTWMDDAHCKGQTALFFSTEDETTTQRALREAAAKAICANCPVTERCLEEAVKGAERGVWGGTTEAERARSARRQRRLARTHRTPTVPCHPEPSWREVASRPNTVGVPCRLSIADSGTTWHGFRWAVHRGDDLAFLADSEAEAWIFFQSLTLT